VTGPIEVPESDGGIIVHAKPGGTIVLAFSADVDPDRAREVVDQIAAGSPDARVIALADVAAVRAWHPDDAPLELAAYATESRKLRDLIRELVGMAVSGTLALRGARRRLKRIAEEAGIDVPAILADTERVDVDRHLL
jgi:hypothetical protein